MAVTILDRELYTVAEAARLLRVPPRTLHNWLEGNVMRGRAYAPVIRVASTGSDTVTWGEFIEAAFLAEYRRVRRVPLQHIRPVIDDLRDRYGIPYPLAHYQPFVADRELIISDPEGGPDRSKPLIAHRKQQLLLAIDEFIGKVDFDNDVALRLWPEGRRATVTIDPDVAFGLPVVRAARTEVIFEMFEAGDSMELIASGLDLTTSQVEDAIRFETRRDPVTVSTAA